MPTTTTVTTLQKGPKLRLIFTITSNSEDDEINTEEITIDNLAKVRFKFKYTVANRNQLVCQPSFSFGSSRQQPNTDYAHITKISIIKQNAEDDGKVKMNVICKALDYSKEFICSDYWTEYMDIGKVPAVNKYQNILFSSQFDVSIIVYKVHTVGFSNLYEDTDFTDFFLGTADGRVAVHKACLGAHSDVFRRMLTSNWKETEEGCIELEDVSVQTLRHLKNYMYMGTIPDDNNELCPLLLLASQYMIQDLKHQCITKLAQTVKSDNLKSLMEFAVDNKMIDLSLAITQLTPEDVVHDAHENMKKRKISETNPEEVQPAKRNCD